MVLIKCLHYIYVSLDPLAKLSACMCVVMKDSDQHLRNLGTVSGFGLLTRVWQLTVLLHFNDVDV